MGGSKFGAKEILTLTKGGGTVLMTGAQYYFGDQASDDLGGNTITCSTSTVESSGISVSIYTPGTVCCDLAAYYFDPNDSRYDPNQAVNCVAEGVYGGVQ